MANKITLAAQPRTLTGRKVKQLRKQGVLPANIFGKKIKSQAIQVQLADFKKVFETAGETSLIEIQLDKSTHPVLVSNIQPNHITLEPLHVDFHQVDLKETVTANVPVVLTGESEAVKQNLGVLVTLLDEIEVEALPTDLPHQIEIDITNLKEVGDSVSVEDLKFSGKVTPTAEPSTVVIAIQEIKEEVEEPVAAPEVETEGAPAGEQPAAPAEQTPASESTES